MSLLLLKVVSGVIVAGSTIAIPLITTYGRKRRDTSLNSQSPQTSKVNQKCFLIETETNEEGLKLLICEDSGYYIFDKNKTFIKIGDIQSTETSKQIKITLEKSGGAETKILTLSGNKWSNLPKDMNFKRSCVFDNKKKEQPSLNCQHSSNRHWKETINLAIFNS